MHETHERVVYTWASREQPILTAALRRLDAGQALPVLEEIRQEVGLDVAQMRIGLDALEDAGYLELHKTMAGPERVGGTVSRVSERARRELGSWPSAEGLLDELARALSRAEAEETQPERKARLRAALEVFTGTGRKVVIDVLSGYVESKLP